MKRLCLCLVVIVLAACAPATQPAAVAPTVAPLVPTAAAANTTAPLTETLAPTNTPSPIPTATRPPTATATPFPPPANVVFKFDDGVSQSQRDTIIQGLAMARAYLGDSRPMTVIAYADLNAQMDELARFRNVPRTSLTRQLQFLQADRAFGGGDLLAFPMSKNWQARTQEDRMRTAVHEYFHAVEAFLTNTDPFNYTVAEWLYEGTADFAAYHVLAKYGFYNLDRVYKSRVERTRGVVSPLSTMEVQRLAEREMISSPYYFGYIADEMLAARSGEDAVLRKFWENYPKYPGWQLAFQATFGISLDDFYKQFEEERRAKFPPNCGTQGNYVPVAPSDPFSIKFVRQDPPGVLTFLESSFTSNPPPPVAYTFCVSGIDYTIIWDSRTSRQYPPGFGGAISCGGTCIIVYIPQRMSAGLLTFAIELPDKRRADVRFDHFVPSGTATPRP